MIDTKAALDAFPDYKNDGEGVCSWWMNEHGETVRQSLQRQHEGIHDKLNVGDGFIFDGVKFLPIAPSMAVYALINAKKRQQKLVEALESVGNQLELMAYTATGKEYHLARWASIESGKINAVLNRQQNMGDAPTREDGAVVNAALDSSPASQPKPKRSFATVDAAQEDVNAVAEAVYGGQPKTEE